MLPDQIDVLPPETGTGHNPLAEPGGPLVCIRGLDVYRTLVVIVVVWYSTYQYAESLGSLISFRGLAAGILGNMGNIITFFFVVTGFLNFRLVVRACLNTQEVFSARSFFVRRLLRVLPIYYLVLLTAWVIGFDGSAGQTIALFEHLSFTQMLDAQHVFLLDGSTWILAVEVWFYLLLALLSPILYRFCHVLQTKTSRSLFLSVLIILCIGLSTIYKYVISAVLHIPLTNYYVYDAFLPWLDSLGVGMLLALLSETYDWKRIANVGTVWLLRLFTVGLVGLALFVQQISPDPLATYLFCSMLWNIGLFVLFFSSLMMSQLEKQQSLKGSSFWTSVRIWSFGVLLWHQPLLVWLSPYFGFETDLRYILSSLAILVISLWLAWLSYWLFEYPISFTRNLFPLQ